MKMSESDKRKVDSFVKVMLACVVWGHVEYCVCAICI